MQTNHLSHFFLTKDSELLALLNKAAPAKGETRVVNHSGGARKFSPPQLQAKYLGKNGGKLPATSGATAAACYSAAPAVSAITRPASHSCARPVQLGPVPSWPAL